MIGFIRHIFHVFLDWSGANNPAANQYGFWSGFGSDIGEFAILGVIITGLKHHNCSVKGCPRVSLRLHKVTGTHLMTCHHHATQIIHARLRAEHKRKYPAQHKLLGENNAT